MDSGGAEPPQVRRVRLDTSYFSGFASSTLLTPCQIVGTPADIVTSSSEMNWTRRAGSMNLWGNVCLQPSMEAQNGKPHPMAWNIGTIPQTASTADRLMASVMAWVMVCRYVERFVYMTPLGLPVVPLV